MSITITQESPILVKAEVKLPWDDFSTKYKEVVSQFSGLVSIPGFRKGKAPAAIVKKRYRPQIISELAQYVIPENLEKVIEEKSLRAVGQPRLSFVDLHENDNLHYIAELDILPEIELKEWRGVEAESLNVSVTDEAVEQELEHRAQHATKRETIEDRGAEDGDTVVVSLTAVDTEAEETLTDIERYEIVLGDHGAHPELVAKLQGIEADNMVTLEFAAPEDDPFEDWAGKQVKVFMEVLEIAKVTLPDLDDEFAKSQDAESMKDLREKVRTQLLESAEEREKQRLEGTLVGKLVDDYDFDVPQALVVSEAKAQIEQQLMPYLRQLGNDEQTKNALMEQMYHMAIPQAEQKIRADLILEKVADDINAEVSEEELDAELEKYLPYSGVADLETLKKQLSDGGRMEAPKLMLKRKKALEALTNEAKITKVDTLSTDEEDGEDGAEEAESKADDKPKKKAKAPAKKSTGKASSKAADTADKAPKKATKATAAKPTAKKAKAAKSDATDKPAKSKATTAKKTTKKADTAE